METAKRETGTHNVRLCSLTSCIYPDGNNTNLLKRFSGMRSVLFAQVFNHWRGIVPVGALLPCRKTSAKDLSIVAMSFVCGEFLILGWPGFQHNKKGMM